MKTVPLSDDTVKDRIAKMGADCQNQLHKKLRKVNFAIQLDEMTTVSDESALIVYVQYIDGEDLQQDIHVYKSSNNNKRSAYIYGCGLISLIQQSAL